MENNNNQNTMLIIAVVAVLLIGGIFVFMRSGRQTSTPAIAPTAMQEDAATEEAVIEPTESMEVSLAAVDKDLNQSGKATLIEEDGKVKVMLDLTQSDELKDFQPAHIHKGECPGVGEVAYPLTNVVSGKSETILNTTLAKLKEELPLAINVHKSANELKVYTTCGSLK